MLKFIPICIILLLGLCSCSHNKEQDNIKNPVELYSKAYKALEDKDYKKSAELFSRITYEFPYYSGAPKAHIMEIYSYYLQEDYDNVIFSVENFVKTYPTSKYIAYAYYIKALALYEQIGIAYRDPERAVDAKAAFEEVASRFKDSAYARNALIKIKMIENYLAAHEMIIGRYYLNKGEVLSAIGRFQEVVSTYGNSPQIEEALYRLAEAYNFLSMPAEARKHINILKQKYPRSSWAEAASKLS